MAEASNISQNTWLAAGGTAIFVFLAGIFITIEQNISGLDEREKAHTANDDKLFTLLQAQLDRRISDLDRQLSDSRQERGAVDVALGSRIDSLSDNVGKRFDDLIRGMAETQRQLSAIEGKLGESLPNPPRNGH